MLPTPLEASGVPPFLRFGMGGSLDLLLGRWGLHAYINHTLNYICMSTSFIKTLHITLIYFCIDVSTETNQLFPLFEYLLWQCFCWTDPGMLLLFCKVFNLAANCFVFNTLMCAKIHYCYYLFLHFQFKLYI